MTADPRMDADAARAYLLGLRAVFADPSAAADLDAAACCADVNTDAWRRLGTTWYRCVEAAHVIADRYRVDYDRNGALAVIAEPVRVCALRELGKTWTACVEVYLEAAA